jgi:carbamate kinase
MNIVVALGGNALAPKGGRGTVKETFAQLRGVAPMLADLAKKHSVAIVHGSGPQVGRLLLQNELTKKRIPQLPLDVLDAEVQGQLGYLIEQALLNELHRQHVKRNVVTVITRIVVDKKDLAFKNPTKPIGPFYPKMVAKVLQRQRNDVYKEDAGRGWRRVVASPEPKRVVEADVIKSLVKRNVIVITAGGGGIPIVKRKKNGKNMFAGVSAVIDKDGAAALIGNCVNAKLLLIITTVDAVYRDFNTKNQKALRKIHLKEAKAFLKKGEFSEGSMAPKIRAAIRFIQKGGKKVVVTDIAHIKKALQGKAGTTIVKH